MSEFEIVRSADIQADPARVHALVADFHEWTAWSPWEDVDQAVQRSYSGADSGVGAHYAWVGNRRAGEGNMEIVSTTPEDIGIRLAFLKPWKATNDVHFTFLPRGTATEVTWRMSGEHKGIWALFGKLFNLDKLVGRAVEKGLTRLKAAAESN